MNFFSGYTFFVYLFAALIPAVILGLSGKSLKYYRMVLTILFIWAIYKDSPVQLAYLMIYAAVAVYLVKIYLFFRKKYGRNQYIYGHAILLAVIPLALSKVSGLYGKSIFGFLGISYICFRVIQIIIETYDGVIQEIEPLQFLNFILFFPCLSSGPIDRSRRFGEDYDKIYSIKEYQELMGTGLYKIL